MKALTTVEMKRLRIRLGALRVRQTSDGEVHAYGDFPRGDGGPSPWWRHEGTADDVRRMLGE